MHSPALTKKKNVVNYVKNVDDSLKGAEEKKSNA